MTVTLRSGMDITLACTGAIVAEVLVAAERLAADGIDATVVHFGTVKPFDADALAAAAAATGSLVTIEEHSIIGGLGSAAAEVLAEHGVSARLRRLGLRDEFAHAVGSRTHLLDHYGLAAPQIATAADELLGLDRAAGSVA